MNATQKIEHANPVSREQMLAALDAAIRGASDKKGFRTGWIVKCKFDSAMLLAVLDWAWETRVAQLNEEDAGQMVRAHQGHWTRAPSSSLNGEADGHAASAPHEGQKVRAAASPTHSNGDGRDHSAARCGQERPATPLLPNEDDAGQKLGAGGGHMCSAPSSSPNGDGDGLCCDGQTARLSVAAPSPQLRPGPRPGARFNTKPNPPRFTSEADVQGVVRRDLAMSIMVPDAFGKLIPLRMIRLSECPAYFAHSAAVASITKDLYARHRYKPENMHKRLGELEPDFATLEKRARKEAAEQWAAEVRS